MRDLHLTNRQPPTAALAISQDGTVGRNKLSDHHVPGSGDINTA